MQKLIVNARLNTGNHESRFDTIRQCSSVTRRVWVTRHCEIDRTEGKQQHTKTMQAAQMMAFSVLPRTARFRRHRGPAVNVVRTAC